MSGLSLIVAWMFTREVPGSGSGTPAMEQISAQSQPAGRGGRMRGKLFSSRRGRFASILATLILLGEGAAFAEPAGAVGGEANLKLPDLAQVRFFGQSGIDGHSLLMYGPLFCILGMIFGLFMYVHLKGLPVHRAMKEVSQLIWETCKTYLINQGKFLLLLWCFIAVVILAYFAVLLHFSAFRVAIILAFSVLGMAGSYFVAWFGIRVNTLANSARRLCCAGRQPVSHI
jgi:K(+)-stimulated pyrophosphate-energized sodium pump